MSTTRIKVVTGDTPPIVLGVSELEAPVDLSDPLTVALLKVRKAGQLAIKGTVTCVKLPGLELEDGTINTGVPYNIAGRGGRVMAVCPSSLFDQEGDYQAELEVTFGAIGRVSTVYDILRIHARAQF